MYKNETSINSGYYQPGLEKSQSPIQSLFNEVGMRLDALMENIDRLNERIKPVLTLPSDQEPMDPNVKPPYLVAGPSSPVELMLNSILEKMSVANNKLFYMTDNLRI